MPPGLPSAPERRRPLALVAGVVAILGWQALFFANGQPEKTLESPYRITASDGVLRWQPEFVYFLYYLNLYPVATITDRPLEYSVEGARRMIAEQGKTLVMERYWTIRYGDLAKTYLYLPHVMVKGRPARPRMLHANAIGFTLALLAVYAALWHVGRARLGAVLVVLLGSNPFQVHEVYANNNLFGWPITLTLLLLALHVPLMRGGPPRMAAAVAIALLSGVLLGTFRQIRTEPTLVLCAVVFVYLTAARLRAWRRLLLVAVVGVAFVATQSAWRGYFEGKYAEAYRVVKAAGGHLYDGPRQAYHFFWHALWCGLGDFDRKYGYQWSDVAAFSYAWPILQRQHAYQPQGYPAQGADEWDPLTFGVYWDGKRRYPRTVQEIPEYIGIVRDKVLRDIAHDPLWYMEILVRRMLRVVQEGTPPSLSLGNGFAVSLPGRALWGWLALLTTLALLSRRDWFHLKLIVFTLPLTGTALLVYSEGGTVFYGVTHLLALGIGLVLAWEAGGARHVMRVGAAARRFAGELARRLAEALPDVLARTRARAKELRDRSWPPHAERLAAKGAAAAVVAVAALVVWAMLGRRQAQREAALPAGGRPLVAVLRFENETKNRALARVSGALGDLVSAELRRGAVQVLDPHAAQWLEVDVVWWKPDGTLQSPLGVAVNVVADRSGAARVVSGRLSGGDGALEACVAVHVPGPVAYAVRDHCEGVDTDRLFDVPPRLAAAALAAMGLPAPAAPAERPAASPKAYLLYAEASEHARHRSWAATLRLLDEALQEDPRLAPARGLRARVWAEWRPLGAEALRELTGETAIPKALAVLRARVEDAPASELARVDLARTLVALEQYEEAESVVRPLLSSPAARPDWFGQVATALSARGALDRGYQVLLEYQRRSLLDPDGRGVIGDHLLRWGNLGLALNSLDYAEYERYHRGMPQWFVDDLVRRWSIHALNADWEPARTAAERIKDVADPRAAGTSALLLARGLLFRGKVQKARALLAQAALQEKLPFLDVSDATGLSIELRLELGDAAGALAFLDEVRAAQAGVLDPRVEFWEPLLLTRLGRHERAAAARRALERAVSGVPGPTGPRLLARLDGELALARGDASRALAALGEAERLLPGRGFCGEHVPIWYALGRAELAAGRPGSAERWLKKVTTAGTERVCWPLEYARSVAMHGQVLASSGHEGAARAAFEQFLDLWGEGELADRELQEARRLVGVDEAESDEPATSAERTGSIGGN